VPLEFTPEDFQEISEGKYLVKVIYLPDPQYQELAAIGTDQIISTRLEPGADPILEAQRRGCILLVIRMGNVDHEAPNTPPLDSASPAQGPAGATPPGLVPAPGIPGPLSPIPGPATPPARDGIGLPPQQPNTNAIAPLNPGALVPPPGPGLGGVSKMREVPPLSPTGAMLPELPPRPSALLPELPSAPPAPADLATQGAKK
jgi:hypothetical protein